MTKKISKKKQALRDSWDAILKKYDSPVFSKTRTRPTPKKQSLPSYRYRGQDDKIASLDTRACDTGKKESLVYTGDAMLGIAVLHKSNAVPIFSTDDAKAVASMRR